MSRLAISLTTAGVLLLGLLCPALAQETGRPPYPIVDTGQVRCYSTQSEIAYPKQGEAFYGQDAQYVANPPRYKDNGDGTVSDLVTGLIWQKDPGEKKTFRQAVAGASKCRVGGHDDWRLPTIKELYSLILFSGTDPDPRSTISGRQKPFIDASQFLFKYGDASRNERIIDSQYATYTRYVSTTMRGNETMFGVNFADGRIKGYPVGAHRGRGEKSYYVMYVRGNADYGKNDFHDNGDGTITDRATGLIWTQVDSGHLKAGKKADGRLTWPEALKWAEELTFAGHSDWRLPSVKELQSIVDYTRSPDTTKSAAIDPIFKVTAIRNEGGKPDAPWYWSSTTHAGAFRASAAAYVAFGRSLGWMQDRRSGRYELMDVHGAGSQRSDPKVGDPSQFPRGRGPQGDVIRIYNHVRCVRGGGATLRMEGPAVEATPGAQEPGRRETANPFMRREDRNGDGKVSREEFRGPPDHFNRFDRNKDGYLTEDEAPKGPPPRPASAERPGHPHPAERRHHHAVPGQGAGTGDAPGTVPDGLRLRRGVSGRLARCVRAADPGRRPRRPHPLHPQRRGGGRVGVRPAHP
ncbi:MAG: DUF1566 domain-containing protein [Planctomycetota bacterium]|nr:DUF1566 domain-containing protein [Planctomycetota bacterium]